MQRLLRNSIVAEENCRLERERERSLFYRVEIGALRVFQENAVIDRVLYIHVLYKGCGRRSLGVTIL